MKIFEELKEMASCYSKKKPNWIQCKIHLLIDKDGFILELGKDDIEVEESDIDLQGDLGLVMDENTFQKLSDGTWNGMTAAGRANMSDPAPLDFRLPEGTDLAPKDMQILYHFLTHFFSKDYPTVTKLGMKHSRVVHGGNAVPIAYGHGIRFAYYTISKGEQINEDEQDPWNQVFTVTKGTGKAVIDGRSIELERNMSVHVPPNVEHIVKKVEGDDDLKLLWIAYGEKA